MSIITVNDTKLNLDDVCSIITQNNKLAAIKYIKNHTNIGLKECKDIVDNLESDPYFYDGETEITLTLPNLEDHHQKLHEHKRKGNHIISEGSSNIKNYIVLFSAIIIIILLFFLF